MASLYTLGCGASSQLGSKLNAEWVLNHQFLRQMELAAATKA